MNEIDIKFTGELTSVSIQPGDTLVLMFPQLLSVDQCKFIKDTMGARFPGHDMIVLDGGGRLGVLSPAARGTLDDPVMLG